MSTLLTPLTSAVAAVLVGAHALVSRTGLDPDSALGWLLAMTCVVLAARTALLPVTIRSVRLAHASATARPHLERIRRAYAGRTDRESLLAMRRETLAVQRDHGMGTLGCLPLLVQIPVLFAVYEVFSRVVHAQPVGAMGAALAASLGSATILTVRLGDRLGTDWWSEPSRLLVLLGLALTCAVLSYLTQAFLVRPNTVTDGMPQALAQAQAVLPTVSALGILISAVAMPAGVLAYWVISNAVALIQQAVITTWFPTPGSPAHARRARRRPVG